MERAIGLIETISIAAGIQAADAMKKVAPVRLFLARPICPGKFIVLVGGDVEAVKNSLKEGRKQTEHYLADSVLISLSIGIFFSFRGFCGNRKYRRT